MALIMCGECKKQISQKAVTCPDCGAPNAKAKKTSIWVWVVLAFVFLWAIGKCSMDSANTAPQELVYNSSYDGSVHQAEAYLKARLKDPDSYQSIGWGKVTKLESGGYQTWHEYRAKNSYGGYDVGKYMFLLSPTGEVLRMDKLGE